MVSANILPGEGIENAFILGNSLYDTVAKMKELNEPLKIAYAAKNYLDTPILVTLPKLATRLMFHSSGNQELMLIEILDFSCRKLCYKGTYLNDIVYSYPSDEELCDPNQIPARKKQVLPSTLKQIYNKIFGPTFPGTLDRERRSYVLSYPGIAFRFKINLDDLLRRLDDVTDSNDILSILTNWDAAVDIPCESLAVYKGESYADFHKRLGALSRSNLVDYSKSGSGLSISQIRVDLARGTAEIERDLDGPLPTATIKIGETTQQDIIRLLGPPDACFNKFDSRLLIHKHLTAIGVPSQKSGSVYKFHNYFRHGVDYLYNLNAMQQSGGVLEKIIIHNGGITESLDFMRWNKCDWTVSHNEGDSTVSVDSSMYFGDFSSEFFERVDKTRNGPVLLNRGKSEIVGSDEVEFVQVEEISSTDVVDMANGGACKTWGQLKLYGFHRCIFEVVGSNGCVSSVTIY